MVWPLTSRCSWDARCAWDTCITWKRVRGTDTCKGCDCMFHNWSCETVELHVVREATTQPLQWLSLNASLLWKSIRKKPWQLSWALCDLIKWLVLTAILLLWSCFAWKGRGEHSSSSQRTRLFHPLVSTMLRCVRLPPKKERWFLTSPFGPGGPGGPGGPCMVTLSPASCRKRVRDSQE